MNRPIIFVAATRSSIRMFSSGACARQSARPAPSVVAGTRCCAQTWYIGTVPGKATPMLALIPVTSEETAAAAWTTGLDGGVHQAGSASRTIMWMSRKPCSSRWRRSASITTRGSWSGTSRMSSRACASCGVTVLGVASVCPDHRPWRLRVVENVSAWIAAVPSMPPLRRSISQSSRMSSSDERSWAAMIAS